MTPLRGIRALTLHQPMASAIAVGPKRLENRPRNMFAAGRLPEWVAIHAGLGWWPVTLAWLRGHWPGHPPPASLPRGKLLGVMLIDWMEQYQLGVLLPGLMSPREREMFDDPWATGPWCAHIAEVRLLDEPIAAKGKQGLWYPDADAQAALRALVEAG